MPAVTAGGGAAFSAAPNTTARTTSPPFNNATFFVPAAGSSAHQVGFTNATSLSDVVTEGWTFFGHVALLADNDGSMVSLFWAVPSGTDGVWTLTWNETETGNGGIPVTLKDTPPPNLS
jgi:hypothetical protein